MLTKIDASTNEHLESWAQFPGSDLWNVQLAMFKETFKTNFNVKRRKVLQFCVTQGHMGQRAIAKKSSFLSQHETPPQLSKGTGRSWSCDDIFARRPRHQKRAKYLNATM